jgi:DNA mismatch repair protein MutL
MTLIKKLDDDLINKIAAGEVVERPASVIKELVENSLDAESTRIQITIQEGGKKLIKICDDGKGIPSEELQLAVSRHATSKITAFDDLYHLKTMGFRGEALASICSIAKVSVASRHEENEASEILVEGGKIVDQHASPIPKGTTITVKYLFYQTPARLKFLKTDETETNHIVNTVTKLALSHAGIGFSLVQGKRTLLDVPEDQSLFERCKSILGKDIAEYLYAFEAEGAGMHVSGYLGHPQISRSQKSFSHLFVNGRAVTDRVVFHALMEAYRDLLMKGKFPVIVLNIQLDENLVDVNVHPTKAEVRFHHSQQVHRLVYQAVRECLQSSPWLEGEQRQSEPTERVSENTVEATANVQKDLSQWGQRYFNQSEQYTTKNASYSQTVKEPSQQTYGMQASPTQKKIQFGKTAYADMQPIGQLLGTYLLCQIEGKLILIDQHAAHERVGFEKLMLEFEEAGVKKQVLLLPETFDLKPSDVDIFQRYTKDLDHFGFEVEHFGGNTFVVKAVPTLLQGKIDIKALITDLVEDFKATGEAVTLKDKLHHVLATMSCHAQIRANHHLNPEEIQALLNELDRYQFTDFCPHGRPVCIEVTLDEIERWFKRVL